LFLRSSFCRSTHTRIRGLKAPLRAPVKGFSPPRDIGPFPLRFRKRWSTSPSMPMLDGLSGRRRQCLPAFTTVFLNFCGGSCTHPNMARPFPPPPGVVPKRFKAFLCFPFKVRPVDVSSIRHFTPCPLSLSSPSKRYSPFRPRNSQLALTDPRHGYGRF